MRLQQTLGTLFLFLFFTLAPAHAEKKTSEQYWTETGLNTDSLRPILVTNKECNSNAAFLRGCAKALGAIAAFAERPLTLLPLSLLRDPLFQVKRVAQAQVGSNFALVELSEADVANKSTRQLWQESNQQREKIRAATEALVGKSIDFEAALADVIRLGVTDRTKDAAAAAAAINAFLVEAMDAHAHINASEELQDSMNDASENFSGIGATIQKLGSGFVIASLVEGGPAQKAGVLPNDVIDAVDGEAVKGMNQNELVSKRIRGPEGKVVVMGLIRGGKPVEVRITRAKIVLENVTAEWKQDLGAKIGVIKLRSFSDRQACGRIAQKIGEFERARAEGLILDLRGNGGGLLDQAVCIGGLFAGKKVIVKTLDLNTKQFSDMVSDRDAILTAKSVILIDAGSASASELLSGALQDHRTSWILGERSFGKGSVQAPVPFMPNRFQGSIQLFRTIARFYQPTQRTNQVVGIAPDFEVAAKPNATEDERFFLREGDLYPNALGAVGAPWVNPRKAEIAQVDGCVKKSGELENAVAKAGPVLDYQMLYAQSVLKCSL